MRLTPAQVAVRLICGEQIPRCRVESMEECIRSGHDLLVRISGRDFGYNLQAWHDHLKESKQGGYTYGRNIELPRIMRDALVSADWQEIVRGLTMSDDEPA